MLKTIAIPIDHLVEGWLSHFTSCILYLKFTIVVKNCFAHLGFRTRLLYIITPKYIWIILLISFIRISSINYIG
jgi:hypothetical protein